VLHLVQDGLSILQYVDDTLLFLDHDLVKTENMKLIMLAFEQVSDLNINYHKSKLYYFGQAADKLLKQRIFISLSFVVEKEYFLLSTWVSQYTIVS
jgi:hypothetical protein